MTSSNFSTAGNSEIYIPKDFLDQAKAFQQLMLYYSSAIQEVETKLNILDKEMASLNPRNPIASIKSRIKSPQSIVDKLKNDNLAFTIDNIEKNLNDVAGVRVICPYIDDIYTVAQLIAKQDDIRVIQTKDFIQDPKPNGYRSLHLIVEIPIFLSTGKRYIRVETQIRTIAMDFWASLEHEIRYKQDIPSLEYISRSLKECAEDICDTDRRMMDIRNLIKNIED